MSAVQRNNNIVVDKVERPARHASTKVREAALRFFFGALALLVGGLSAHAQTVTATLPAGANTQPYAVAVNPVTNTIYMVNQGANNVTVINGLTNSTSTVTDGPRRCPWRSP